jgi:hypothetical protein
MVSAAEPTINDETKGVGEMARLFFGLALAGLINIASVIAPVMAADDWVAVTAEDLEGLDAREHDRFDQFYVKSGTDLSSYGSLYLNEPIEFAIEDDEIDDALRTSDRNALSRHFRNALEDRLDGRLTDESGEGILVLQVFIVDVRPNRDLSGDFPSSDTSARRSRSSSRRSVGIGRVTGDARDGFRRWARALADLLG